MFEYPSGKRLQLDYDLFRKKWRNSVNDYHAYSSFNSVCSDHRIVSAHIKLSLRASKKSLPHPMKAIDWKTVSLDKDLSNRFAIEVQNKFQPFLSDHELELENIDEIYSTLSNVTVETATEMLSKKKTTKYQRSITQTVKEAREKLKSISLQYHAKPTILKKVALTKWEDS